MILLEKGANRFVDALYHAFNYLKTTSHLGVPKCPLYRTAG